MVTSRAKRAALLKRSEILTILTDFFKRCHQPRETRGPTFTLYDK